MNMKQLILVMLVLIGLLSLLCVMISYNVSGEVVSFSQVSTNKCLYRDVTGSTWATVHDSTTSSVYNTWQESYSGEVVGSTRHIIYRAFYVFDTSSIPDNSVIVSAKLYVNYNYFGGGADNYYYQMANCGSTVDTPDFNLNNFTTLIGSFYISATSVQNTSLNNTGSCISKTGYTQIVLRNYHDYYDVEPVDDTHGIGTNQFTTVKLWVVYTTTPPIVTLTNINATSNSSLFWNNTGGYFFVNVSCVGNCSSCNMSGYMNASEINNSGLYVYIAGFELNPLTFEILLLLGLLYVAYKFSHRYFLVHPFLFFMAIMILLIDFADLKDIFLSDDSFGLFSALYITAFFVILFVKLRKGFKEWDDTRKNRKH